MKQQQQQQQQCILFKNIRSIKLTILYALQIAIVLIYAGQKLSIKALLNYGFPLIFLAFLLNLRIQHFPILLQLVVVHSY